MELEENQIREERDKNRLKIMCYIFFRIESTLWSSLAQLQREQVLHNAGHFTYFVQSNESTIFLYINKYYIQLEPAERRPATLFTAPPNGI